MLYRLSYITRVVDTLPRLDRGHFARQTFSSRTKPPSQPHPSSHSFRTSQGPAARACSCRSTGSSPCHQHNGSPTGGWALFHGQLRVLAEKLGFEPRRPFELCVSNAAHLTALPFLHELLKTARAGVVSSGSIHPGPYPRLRVCLLRRSLAANFLPWNGAYHPPLGWGLLLPKLVAEAGLEPTTSSV